MATATFNAELERLGPDGSARNWTRAESELYCRRLADSHYENFSVLSWFLPRNLKPHFCHIYGYCRWADDLADETAGGAESLRLLDWWQDELDACYRGVTRHPVFVALADTIATFEVPKSLFDDLLVAFRQDQVKKRYADRRELLEYCRNSANPVGRLVLCLFRMDNAEALRRSDAICTGLQLANFWQDVARDWAQNRRYLPEDTMRRHGLSETAFATRQATPEFCAALADEVARAERLLCEGSALVQQVPRTLRRPIWLFAAGGRTILKRIAADDYDVWTRRPIVSRSRKVSLLVQSLWLPQQRAVLKQEAS